MEKTRDSHTTQWRKKKAEYFIASDERTSHTQRIHTNTHKREGLSFYPQYSCGWQTHVSEANAKHQQNHGKPVFRTKVDVYCISGKQHIAQHGCSLLLSSSIFK